MTIEANGDVGAATTTTNAQLLILREANTIMIILLVIDTNCKTFLTSLSDSLLALG